MSGRISESFFVTGAARSGKSRYAEELATSRGDGVLYVATAEALDGEMDDRIATHRARRPEGWKTLEARRDVAAEIEKEIPVAGRESPVRTVLLDCVSLLVSNILLDAERVHGDAPDLEARVWDEVERELDALLYLGFREPRTDFIFVSNEVGWGVVPPSRLGRVYRDLLGRANQRLASGCDHAVLLVAGLPVPLKGSPPS